MSMGWQPETQPKGKPPLEKTKGAETMQRLIDADALTDKLIKEIEADTDKSIQASLAKSVCMIFCKAIEQQPTVNAEPVRHGKWREYPISDGMNQCSKCGVLRFGKSNYCPNCGCRMDEE